MPKRMQTYEGPDITVTFERLTPAMLEGLRSLPLLKLTHTNSTVEMTVRGEEAVSSEVANVDERTFDDLLARVGVGRHLLVLQEGPGGAHGRAPT